MPGHDVDEGAGVGDEVGDGADGGELGGGGVQPPGGIHPPLRHVQPAPGDGPTHPAGPAAAGEVVAEVTNVKTSDAAASDGLRSVAYVRDTICQ